MIHHDIPFRSQYWDLDDWQALGFGSKEDAVYWQGSSCGVLCIGMILEKVTGRAIRTSELISKGVSLNAYTHVNGWSHDGLVRMIKEYDVHASRAEKLPLAEIRRLLDEGQVVIISIKWAFRPIKSLKEYLFFWKKIGGHLAVVTGYSPEGFYVHHTSIRPEYNWEHKLIPSDEFKRGFTGRGIIINTIIKDGP